MMPKIKFKVTKDLFKWTFFCLLFAAIVNVALWKTTGIATAQPACVDYQLLSCVLPDGSTGSCDCASLGYTATTTTEGSDCFGSYCRDRRYLTICGL